MKYLSLIFVLSINFSLTAIPAYEIQEITAFSDNEEIYPYFINQQGQVVGAIDNAKYSNGAFFWDKQNGLRVIEPMHIMSTNIKFETYLIGLNDEGKVIGFITHEDEYCETFHDQSFLWTEEAGFDFLTLNGQNFWASSINSQGEILGMTSSGEDEEYERRFFIRDKEGKLKELDLSNSKALPLFIDDKTRAFFIDFESDLAAFFVWDQGKIIKPKKNTDFLPEVFNRRGTVAGIRSFEVETIEGIEEQSFLWMWSPGKRSIKMVRIESSNLSIHGMNDDGVIVGNMEKDESDVACLWSDSTGLVDLNDCIDPDSGWKLYQANDINNAGQIIGAGEKEGRLRAFILTLDFNPVIGE